jgi:cell shape-determining protein MreC
MQSLNKYNMHKIVEEILASSVWGVSVASLVLDWDIHGVTTTLQLIVAIAGAIYFLFIKIPHDFKINRLNRKKARLENEVLKHEIEDYEEEDEFKANMDENK